MTQGTVGHVHLKVSDLAAAVEFYRDVVGMKVTAEAPGAAFMSFDENHHDLGLNTWGSRDGGPPPPGSTGLFHSAFLYPSRLDLARALKRAIDAGITLDGASDHLVSEAVYLRDPSGNGVELYCDRPAEEWPRNQDGSIQMATLPLDLDDLMAELE